MKIGSLFSGIDGFGLAATRCGMEIAWQVEINPFRRRVLEKHFPDVPRHTDIRRVKGDDLGSVGIISAGFPCQDLSVAGRRAGLAGARSGLYREVVRLAAALRPPWILLENVPGLLSQWTPVEPPPGDVEAGCEWEVEEGSDFEYVIHSLGELGYLGAWRMLDAQWFGVAQQRRRPFIVGCLGRERLAALLPFLQSGQGDPAPRREAAQIASSNAGSGAGTARPGNERSEARMLVQSGGVAALTANGVGTCGADDGQAQAGHILAVDPYIVNAAESCAKESHARRSEVARAIDSRGSFAANQGGTVVACAGANGARTGRSAGAQDAASGHMIPVARADGTRNRLKQDQETLVAAPITASYCKQPDSSDRNGGPPNIVRRASGVRRLTPTECERLQGYPDGYTCLCGKNEGRSWGDDPCTCPDTPRYQALGDSLAVPVAEWILRIIADAEAIAAG